MKVGNDKLYKPLCIQYYMNNITKQVFIGSLMGDGSLAKPRPKHRCYNSFYSEQHTFKQKDYVIWKCELLKELGTKTRIMSRMRWNVLREEIHIYSRSLPELTILRKAWYPEGIKKINDNILDEFTEISLAMLIQDDGSRVGRGMMLCTESFTYEEIKKLSNILIDKWDLKNTITKCRDRYSRIYIKTKSVDLLLPIVEKWIHPTMRYKFDNRFKYVE